MAASIFKLGTGNTQALATSGRVDRKRSRVDAL